MEAVPTDQITALKRLNILAIRRVPYSLWITSFLNCLADAAFYPCSNLPRSSPSADTSADLTNVSSRGLHPDAQLKDLDLPPCKSK